MAAITASNIEGVGWKAVTVTTLGASDTLTYDSGKDQILFLYNDTAGALTPLIDGSAASAAIPVPGFTPVSATGGITSASVAAGGACAMVLKANSAVMAGTIAITGGTGMIAVLMERGRIA
jgi:hypothetical protein